MNKSIAKAFQKVWGRIPLAGLQIKAVFRAGLAAVMFFIFTGGAAFSADTLSPDADKILRSMAMYMEGLSVFSVNADIDNEIIDLAGQKLQFSSAGNLVFKRPGNLYLNRKGVLANIELIFGGRILTLHGKNHNAFFQIDSPGTIDNAFETIRNKIGFDVPGADLFYGNPYAGLSDGVVSSSYLGTAFVNGVECHYLTFREAKVDWQLWVRAEGDPLPMKYIITTKWMTGAPQYSVRFRDWNLKPQIEPGQFDFTAAKGEKQIEILHADEMGNIEFEETE